MLVCASLDAAITGKTPTMHNSGRLTATFLLAACVLSPVAASRPARADDAADWKLCTGDKADDVIASCTRLLEGKPDAKNQTIALGNRGWGYNQKGDFDKSLSDYQACLKVTPTDDYCMTELSDTYNLRKDYDKAIEAAEAAIKNNPKSEYANYNKGYALYKKGDYDHAITSFSAAADLNPRYGKAYYQRGQAEAYKLDYAAAIADDNKALAIDPLYDAARGARGFAELNTGKFDVAQADLDQQLASMQSEIKQLKAERSLWERRVALLRSDRLDPDMLDERARALLGLADPRDLTLLIH